MNHVRAALLLALVALTAAGGAPDGRVVALRENNTSALAARGRVRALTVRDRTVTRLPEAAEALLLFCRQRGVSRLFVAANNLPAPENVDASFGWSRLITGAKRLGMSVYVVLGAANWVTDSGTALTQMDALLSFNAAALPGETLDGVLIELPGLNEDLAAPTSPASAPAAGAPLTPTPALLSDPVAVQRQVEAIARAARHLAARDRSGRLRVGASVPAWMQVQITFDGETRDALRSIVDLVQFIVVHNQPNQTTDVGAAADAALAAAGPAGKSVLTRIDLAVSPRAIPALATLARRDELLLETTVSDVRARHQAAAGFGGVLLDDYVSYATLPEERSARGGGYLPGGYPSAEPITRPGF
jgi:hypothetical protein